MARKSEIRAAAKAGLEALIAAMDAKDEKQADAKIREAFGHLGDAAGIVPKGKRLSEGAGKGNGSETGGGEGDLLGRLGLNEDGSQMDELELRERRVREAERRGLLDSVFGSAEAELLRELG